MSQRTFILATFVLLTVTPAAAQVKLEQKYVPGTTYRQQLTAQRNQKFVLPSNTDINSITLVTVAAGPADGCVTVSEKSEALSVKSRILYGEFKFDSADPATFKAPNPNVQSFVDNLKKQMESPIEYSIASGQVGEVKGIVEGSLQNAEDFRLSRQRYLAQIPPEEIQPGHTWEGTEETDFGQGQTLSTTRKYTYVGTVDKFATVKGGKQLHKFEFTDTDAKYFLKPNRGLEGEVKKSDLRVHETKGTLLFDPELGRVVRSDSQLHVVGEIDLVLFGTPLAGPADLKVVSAFKEL